MFWIIPWDVIVTMNGYNGIDRLTTAWVWFHRVINWLGAKYTEIKIHGNILPFEEWDGMAHIHQASHYVLGRNGTVSTRTDVSDTIHI